MKYIITGLLILILLVVVTTVVSAEARYTERVQVGWGKSGLPVYCNISTVSWLHSRGYLTDSWEPIAIWQPTGNSTISYQLVYHKSWDTDIPLRYANMTEPWYRPVYLVLGQ